ncbi:YheO domain-containing protein [Pseudomonas putida S11]|nr:YheO domain-containing protein [Pseudomonas putida S11]
MQASADQHGCEPVVLPDYPTTLKGRTLRSATAIFRDSSGHPFASLCVNTDVTGLDAAMNFLRQFQPTAAAPAVSEPADMELLMSEIIQASLQRSGQGRMNKQAKVEAVRVMQERGLFIVKGGVEKGRQRPGCDPLHRLQLPRATARSQPMTLHIHTPLIESRPLSLAADSNVWLKLEALQPCGSFKLRGVGHACEVHHARGARPFRVFLGRQRRPGCSLCRAQAGRASDRGGTRDHHRAGQGPAAPGGRRGGGAWQLLAGGQRPGADLGQPG